MIIFRSYFACFSLLKMKSAHFLLYEWFPFDGSRPQCTQPDYLIVSYKACAPPLNVKTVPFYCCQKVQT